MVEVFLEVPRHEPRPSGVGSVGRGITDFWNSMFMNISMGLGFSTSARAGFTGSALKCWCTQFMCTIATSPADQS
jgi:hypothetical protein